MFPMWNNYREGGDCLKLRQVRTEKGLTQAELSKKSGVSRSKISQYESGQMFPQVPTLLKLANALGCTMNDLVEQHAETA